MILEMTATCVSEKIKTKSIELGQRMSYLPSTFFAGRKPVGSCIPLWCDRNYRHARKRTAGSVQRDEPIS